MKKVSVTVLFLIMLFGVSFNLYAKDDLNQLQKKCDDGSAKACFNLANIYNFGEDVKQDLFKSVELYQRACSYKDSGSCYSLAVSYHNGWGAEQSNQKALEMFDKACGMKSQPSCDKYSKLKRQTEQ